MRYDDATLFTRIGFQLLAHLHAQAAAPRPGVAADVAAPAGGLPAAAPAPAPAADESVPPLSTRPASVTPLEGRVVLVTSVRPGEGKSFVSRTLAHALAEQQRGDVVWADAAFDTAPEADDPSRQGASGLSEIMTVGALQGLAPHPSGPERLWRLGRGVLAQSSLLYRPDEVRRGLFALRAGFALSVLDAPTLDNCGALLDEVDAVILVVDARHTPRHLVQAGLERARLAPGVLAGVVLNHRPEPLPRWLGGD